MPEIALFGAAGAIGHSIVSALKQRGLAYRVVGRDRSRLEKSFGSDPKAEIVAWNPDDPASVHAAAQGIDTMIYLVGVPYNHFELHPKTMQQTLEGAIAAGVRRILLIGTVYPYGAPQSNPVTENHSRDPTTFKGRMRKEQEELLLAADKAGKIEAVILRLPDFYGPGVEASLLDRAFKAAVEGKTADMIGPIDTPHEFVFVPDVGPVALDLASKAEARGRWWNFAGAGVASQKQLVEMAFAQTGNPMKTRVMGKTMLRIVGLFNPFMRELVEMHYLQTTPVLMDDTAIHKLLGNVKKTRYSEGVRQSIEYLRGNAAKQSGP